MRQRERVEPFGIKRHETRHYGMLLGEEQKFAVLHPVSCEDRQGCEYAKAAVKLSMWPEDEPMRMSVKQGLLVPGSGRGGRGSPAVQ